MKIKIEHKDITEGIPHNIYRNPIALAIFRITNKFCSVSRTGVSLGEEYFTLPLSAVTFLRDFNNSLPVCPIEFELDIVTPEQKLSAIDEILARRPALDKFDTRSAKIEHAIETASRVDDLEQQVKNLERSYRDSLQVIKNYEQDINKLRQDMNQLDNRLAFATQENSELAKMDLLQKELGAWREYADGRQIIINNANMDIRELKMTLKHAKEQLERVIPQLSQESLPYINRSLDYISRSLSEL